MIARIRYWLASRRCSCKGYPHRFAGGTVQVDEMLHRTDGPCYLCDTYGAPARPSAWTDAKYCGPDCEHNPDGGNHPVVGSS